MKAIQRVQGIWKIVSVLSGVVIILGFIITLGCIKIEYNFYINDYFKTQISEKESLSQKINVLLADIKSYLILAQTRIEAAQRAPETIQKIIASMIHFSSQNHHFSLQKVTYENASSSRTIISRLGSINLDKKKSSSELPLPGAFFLSNEEVFIGQIGIKNELFVEGVLKIQLSMTDILNFLGPSMTLQFPKNPFDSNFNIIMKDQPPLSLNDFVKIHWQHYGAFFCLVFLFILGLIVGIFVIYRQFQLNHKDHITFLKQSLRNSEKQLEELSLKLIKHTIMIDSLEKASKAQQQLQEQYFLRLRERSKIIELSLEALKQSFTNPTLNITEREEAEIVANCLIEAKALAMGVWNVVNEEEINLKDLIEKILESFKGTIAKMDASCSIKGDIVIMWDTLFVKFLLINFIGKAIHRLHNNGRVEITLSMDENGSHISLVDNGFPITGSWEKVFKIPFILYVNDDKFRSICRVNGLRYHFESQKDSNISSLIFPSKNDVLNNIDRGNVVELFKN